MKKRFNKLTALFLTVTCLSVAFLFGKENGSSVNAEDVQTETVLINDFESFVDFNYLTMNNALGKVSMNVDEQFVSSGETSACVYVQPDLFNGRMDAKIPTLFHSLNLIRENKDYTNFRYVTKVSAMVYNGESTAQEIGLQLVYTVKNRAFVSGKAQWYSLEPNSWTEITFEIGSKTIPIAYKKKACGVNFVFKRPTETQSGYTLYIDELAIDRKVV